MALAELGFLMLLFLSGFEIDLHVFERPGTRPTIFGLAVFWGTLACSWVAAQVMGLSISLTLVQSTTSVGLVVPTLRATRRMSTPTGQDILVSALIFDFLTLLAVAGAVRAAVRQRRSGRDRDPVHAGPDARVRCACDRPGDRASW